MEAMAISLISSIGRLTYDQLRIESNNGGRIFAINVRKLVTMKRKSCLIQARPTTTVSYTHLTGTDSKENCRGVYILIEKRNCYV